MYLIKMFRTLDDYPIDAFAAEYSIECFEAANAICMHCREMGHYVSIEDTRANRKRILGPLGVKVVIPDEQPQDQREQKQPVSTDSVHVIVNNC